MNAPTTERLDLELYADRLARHAERLADEFTKQRLIAAWSDLEQDVRGELTDDQISDLVHMGVIGELDHSNGSRAIMETIRGRMESLAAIQSAVERRLAAL